ncbi:hypothetical protein N7517_004708 [Penicillium concentricum]|uniref:Uncharacterized protein n=1 Tax=Penicillium concentricum TaxID=293559 RepID=A0A9W9V8I4_9EURO|nr:uncharacterized protein N7517_004708 [Penicillium concentricum]KAJ5372702.1 hypothetical protein N7517_004708 [Penicillium concentricum]
MKKLTKEVADQQRVSVPDDRQLEQLTQLRVQRARYAEIRRRLLRLASHIRECIVTLLRPYSYPLHPVVVYRLANYKARLTGIMENLRTLQAEERLGRHEERLSGAT